VPRPLISPVLLQPLTTSSPLLGSPSLRASHPLSSPWKPASPLPSLASPSVNWLGYPCPPGAIGLGVEPIQGCGAQGVHLPQRATNSYSWSEEWDRPAGVSAFLEHGHWARGLRVQGPLYPLQGLKERPSQGPLRRLDSGPSHSSPQSC
jgi:hypothetical protein